MRKKTEEYLKTAAEVYCILLFVLLPLYMRDGFYMIGDVKYQFFRNVTVMFCVLLSALQFLWRISGGGEGAAGRLSWTDMMMLGYLAASLLSFGFSMDRPTALWGFSGWHMGFFSQFLFVWAYFALSRCGFFIRPIICKTVSASANGDTHPPGNNFQTCSGTEMIPVEKVIWYCFLCVWIVMSVAVMNRYVYDPLGTLRGMEPGSWDAEHLLSTIGNQNWYCGYLSVAASACFYLGYVGEKYRKAAGLAGSLLVFLTILTQGSESGYLIPLGMMAVLLPDALGSRKKLLRFCSITLCCPAAALLGVQGIRLRGLVLVEDGSLRRVLFWKGWAALFALSGIAVLVLAFREKRGKKDYLESGKLKKAAGLAGGILAAAAMAVFILCQVSDRIWMALGEKSLLRITDGWGNDRGALWRMSLEYFMQSPLYRKVFGAGPDCFYHAVYSVFAVNDIIHPTGQWETAVYANAHNEWLNMLVNQGRMGLACYAGIFITGFVRLWRARRRCKEAYWGILAIAGYCLHGAVSFQQTTSTPLIFAVLGISEAMLRARPGFAPEEP